MKLRSLRLHGFKSFADRTEIHFHEGITSIVGPNGCGKSNISDAIRWVLGEQRPTAIRGAKMDEAIFQGTVNRRPVNRGSVAMVVSNEDGSLPVPFEEVEISRTVYRDGGSEYGLNRSACRLRDIHDLCRDTGLGTNAYAVIESRMIDAILSDRAEERRSMFEEAAGIGKYKDRRKAAMRRLEQAEMDLQRLEDVIGEVESKVRSLARQKGRAERYQRLRRRRLAVEVAVVRHELESLQGRLSDVERALEGDAVAGEGMTAELRAAEARYESLRIRQVEAERDRAAAAARLDEVKSKLVEWERDLAVADERSSYAERRLKQIGTERASAEDRARAFEADRQEIEGARDRLAANVEALRADEEASRGVAQGVRERLLEARQELEALEDREREVARRAAQLQGDAESSEVQAQELGRRLDRLVKEEAEAASQLSDLETQGDLFTDRLAALDQAVADAEAEVAAARTHVSGTRDALEAARARELAAADHEASLAARLGTLEAMDRAGEGVEPAVREALEAAIPGVLGTLADSIKAATDVAKAVETFLGPLARGLVVEDRAAAVRAQRWFSDTWKKGGGLILLPLDSVPSSAGTGGLLARVETAGRGAPWVRALLGGVDLVEEDDLLGGSNGVARVSSGGSSRDARGVVWIGNPTGATGVLERREEIRSLRASLDEARAKARAAREGREATQAEMRAAEEALESRWNGLRLAVDSQREARGEASAHGDRRARTGRHRAELERQLEGTRAARSRAQERASAARTEREELLAEEDRIREDRGAARERLDRVEAEWESARAAESRATVERIRVEGELERARDRHDQLALGHKAERDRIVALRSEAEQLEGELDQARAVRAEGEVAMETLFAERDRAAEELRSRDGALSEVIEAMDAAEKHVRATRTAEREAIDRRHRFELERQELVGRIARARERLEAEWGRSLEDLFEEAEEAEGTPEELRAEYQEIVQAQERLGLVNMLAVEEHEEESRRLAFLREQRDDLVEARNDLRSAIREINQTATQLFSGTFEAIRQNFQATFLRLFEGGECDLWLSDPEEPLESPIEIHASPRGKRTQRIDLLSGGERALTALSLLFGIYLVKPSPFCVLDEVDAPLDESNIGRFVRLLQEFKSQTQFVVITHNPRTIEAADWIYGVTMEEPGVSSIVGVRLEEALEASGSAA